jgi:hypothetical protein
MNDFFVLGQIPGTGLIITFTMWMQMAALLVTLLIWAAYRRRREFMDYTIPTISQESAAFKTSTAQ